MTDAPALVRADDPSTPATPTALTEPPTRRRGRWIDHWDPEDERFWQQTGRAVARRNLAFSILAEHLGFSVWLLWSVVVVSLPAAGFAFSVDQLFWLVALPSLVGATLRLPYTFAVPVFGGRNWTVISALLLLVPTALLAWCVSDPETSYGMFLVAAATAGVGGGNFASSMVNIAYFYPERHKGVALGVNAAGGNVGVAVVQLGVPFVISWGTGTNLAYAGLVWMPLVIVAAACAFVFMDNLSVIRSDVRGQLVGARRRQTWIISFLYVGTFGSFMGYAAAFPLLIGIEFPGVTVGHFAFLGALVGSASRPLGGLLADRLGGARITAWSFVGLAAGTVIMLAALGSFPAFLTSFLVLFVLSGIGNGAVYRLIPAVFQARYAGRVGAAAARREAGTCIGIASAVGAFGGFLVPRAFGSALEATGSIAAAFALFLGFYVACLGVTWWCYLRRRVVAGQEPTARSTV